jgi:membrane-associated protease RseP (regulator of RpoE activity)
MTRTFLPTPVAAIALAIALLAPLQLAAGQSAEPAAPVDAAADTSSADTAADTTADATIAPPTEPSASTDASADATIATPPAEGQPAATAEVPQTGADAQLDATAAGQANLPGQSNNPNAQPSQPTQPQNAQPQTPSSGAQIQAGAGTQADLSAQPQLGQPNAPNANVAADLGVQFGAPTARGLTINSIDRASVLASSGLRARDVLVSFSGQPVRSLTDFQRFIALHPGQRIPVVILRDGREQTVYITPPPARSIVQRPAMPGAPLPSQPIAQASLGVTFDPQFPNLAIVREVRPGSPAEHAGLRTGDMINALNGQRTSTPQHVINAVARMQPGQEVQIDFSRRSAVVLAENSAVRHSVGYAPQAPTQPGIVQPAPTTRVLVPADGPDAVVVPGVQRPGLSRRDFDDDDFDDDGDIMRPGDADRDGRVWDGDGRLRERDGD